MISGFLPNTNVLTYESRLKPISTLTKDEKIYSIPSVVNEVQSVEKFKYSGNLMKIRCLGQVHNVECSDDQKFYVVKKETRDFCRRKFSQIKIEFFEKSLEIEQARSLRKGDYLLIPKHSFHSGNSNLKLENFIYTHSSKLRHVLPSPLLLSKRLFRWFGYFLAEGMVVFTSNKNYEKKCSGINFNINRKEKFISRDIIKTGKRVFQINHRIIDFPERNGRRIDYYSTQLGELMFSLFKTGSSKKTIHPVIMNNRKELLDELIFGWLVGDGWIDNSIGKKGVVYGNTTSIQLANQIYTILINRRRLPSLSIAAHRDQNRVKARKMGFYLKNPLYRITLPKNLKYCLRKQNLQFVFTPISEIKSKEYNGTLHNLRLNGNNSFQANFVWVLGF